LRLQAGHGDKEDSQHTVAQKFEILVEATNYRTTEEAVQAMEIARTTLLGYLKAAADLIDFGADPFSKRMTRTGPQVETFGPEQEM
jgi:hypothetical protein